MRPLVKNTLRALAVLCALLFLGGYVGYALGYIDPYYFNPWAERYRPLDADFAEKKGMFASVWLHDKGAKGRVVSRIERKNLEPFHSPYGRKTVYLPRGEEGGHDELWLMSYSADGYDYQLNPAVSLSAPGIPLLMSSKSTSEPIFSIRRKHLYPQTARTPQGNDLIKVSYHRYPKEGRWVRGAFDSSDFKRPAAD
jgi:hypothetical protein